MATCTEAAPRLHSTRPHLLKHGWSRTPTYRAWIAMRCRCYRPKSGRWFHRYGGRGIKVCASWRRSFQAFLADMGPRPSPRHSLDRFPDPDGDYKPGNVRWATPTEQSLNTCRNVFVTHDGRTLRVPEWAAITGLSPLTIRSRLRLGWTPDQALTTPLHVGARRKSRPQKLPKR